MSTPSRVLIREAGQEPFFRERGHNRQHVTGSDEVGQGIPAAEAIQGRADKQPTLSVRNPESIVKAIRRAVYQATGGTRYSEPCLEVGQQWRVVLVIGDQD